MAGDSNADITNDCCDEKVEKASWFEEEGQILYKKTVGGRPGSDGLPCRSVMLSWTWLVGNPKLLDRQVPLLYWPDLFPLLNSKTVQK